MPRCERCDDQRENCWVFVGVTVHSEIWDFDHMHFEFVERCPFCNPLGAGT